VVPALFQHGRAYIFQNPDGRVVFAIPYERAYTLIGTTEVEFSGDPAKAAPTDEEIAYLCGAASAYFAKAISPEDAVWSFSGVRPLHDDRVRDPKAASRDYVLELDVGEGRPAVLSVFGGKLTTYRRLAEAALDRLAPYLPAATGRRAGWTAEEPLPGGDFPIDGLANLAGALAAEYPFLSAAHAARLAAAYGTRAKRFLAGARVPDDLGCWFGATLSQAELCYLMDEEWAQTADDVLWRRTKLGLAVAPQEAERLARFMAQAAPNAATVRREDKAS
jgi:glycerol-3-phosphate dehydrogenase